jgi:hypothetical protein
MIKVEVWSRGKATKFVTGVVNKGKYHKKVKIATSANNIMLKTGNFHKKFLISIKKKKTLNTLVTTIT